MGEDKRILQLGGIGGLLAGISFILASISRGLTPRFSTSEEVLQSYLESATLHLLNQAFLFVAILLFIPLLLALYRSLRKSSPAGALLGSVIGVMGLTILAISLVSSLAALSTLSGLYAAATPAEKTTIVIVAEVMGSFGLSIAGRWFFALSFVSFGVAMLGSPAYKRRFGWVTVILGIFTGLVAPFALIPGSHSEIGWGLLSLILGWKVYSLSRAA